MEAENQRGRLVKDLIGRTLNAMSVEGVTPSDICDMLTGEGLSVYDAYLTYKAAQLIQKGQDHDTRQVNDERRENPRHSVSRRT